MKQKSKVTFLITACLLVAVHSNPTLDCRKMVYSRHCRGVAMKRADIGSLQKQPDNLDDISLKRLLYDLGMMSEISSSDEDTPQRKKTEDRIGNEALEENADVDRLIEKLFMSFKRRNNDNENIHLFEY